MGTKYEIVEALLRQYRENLSDYEICYNELCKLQQQLILHEKGRIESKEEIIEGLCNHAPVLSDIPRSITNQFHSATENAVINYRYYLQPSELEINAIIQTIKDKAKLLYNYYEQIKLVDRLFICLSEQEKFIIDNIYIKGFNQRQTMMMFNLQFPACFVDTRDAIKIKKFKALWKMEKRLK